MRFTAFLLTLLLFPTSVFCASITVSYEQTRRELSDADLARLPSTNFTALDHGQSRNYRGIPVRDILTIVDAPLGEKLRGPAIALAVRVRAADGYVAAFGLAEFDSAFREQTIYLVDQQDGAPLPPNAGPWRIVCVGDKKGARSVRQVVSLEIISLASSTK